MLAALSTIFALIEQFPELLGVAIALKKLWEQYESDDNRAQEVAQIRGAIEHAKANKDTTNLTALINGIITK